MIGEIPFSVLFPLFGGMTGTCLFGLGYMLYEEWQIQEGSLDLFNQNTKRKLKVVP